MCELVCDRLSCPLCVCESVCDIDLVVCCVCEVTKGFVSRHVLAPRTAAVRCQPDLLSWNDPPPKYTEKPTANQLLSLLDPLSPSSNQLPSHVSSLTCAVQARHNSAPLSATQGPAVPDWLCYASLGHRQQTAILRSASRHQLLVPRYQLSSLGRRSFAVAGPTTWNSLSADLRDLTCSDEFFRRSLKTFLFAKY